MSGGEVLKQVSDFKAKLDDLMKTKLSETPVDPKKAMIVLKGLLKLPMTLDVLQETRVGLTINELRKRTNNNDVKTFGKRLIKNWKKLLDAFEESNAQQAPESGTAAAIGPAIGTGGNSNSNGEKENAGGHSKKGTKRAAPSESDESENSKKIKTEAKSKEGGGIKIKIKRCKDGISRVELPDPVTVSAPAKMEFAHSTKVDELHRPPPMSPLSAKNSGVNGKAPTVEDAVRIKFREMILIGMFGGFGDKGLPEGAGDPKALVNQMETYIFKEFKDTGMKYRNKMRSRLSNLSDPKNPELRHQFLTGKITPARLANMTVHEMASEELKQLRESILQEAINKAQLATNSGTKTDMLKCGKCGGNNCMYNQLQTRSADEPMTTFAMCTDCGNRWKFN